MSAEVRTYAMLAVICILAAMCAGLYNNIGAALAALTTGVYFCARAKFEHARDKVAGARRVSITKRTGAYAEK